MNPNENQQTQQMQIPIRFLYNRESKMVEIWVYPLSMVMIPFGVFKDGYHKMNEAQRRNREIPTVSNGN